MGVFYWLANIWAITGTVLIILSIFNILKFNDRTKAHAFEKIAGLMGRCPDCGGKPRLTKRYIATGVIEDRSNPQGTHVNRYSLEYSITCSKCGKNKFMKDIEIDKPLTEEVIMPVQKELMPPSESELVTILCKEIRSTDKEYYTGCRSSAIILVGIFLLLVAAILRFI